MTDLLELEPHGPDTWVGTGPSYPWGGLYGGQIVAQALMAASHSVPDQYAVNSLHAYFIRRGDASAPIRFDSLDGRLRCSHYGIDERPDAACFMFESVQGLGGDYASIWVVASVELVG